MVPEILISDTSGCLIHGDESIAFTIRKGSHKRTRIAVRITREGEVEVLLPAYVSPQDALPVIIKRADWIVTHLQRIQAAPKPQRLRYETGETVWYLGQPLTLQLVDLSELTRTAQSVRFVSKNPEVQWLPEASVLRVRLSSPSPGRVKTKLEAWYRNQAQTVFTERLQALCATIPWLHHEPQWKLKTMKRRWGSCSQDGVITLNTHLIKAPLPCIDYVILHELAHLLEHNHSKRYYAILEQLEPNWKALRQALEANTSFFIL